MLDIEQIKQNIQSMDKETILKLLDLLGVKEKVKQEKKKVKAKPKRSRPKKAKKVEVEPEPDIVDQDDDDQDETPQPQRKARPRIKKSLGANKGAQARVEPFTKVKRRPNLFLQSKLKDAHKDDTKIDKKLNAGRQPVERGVRSDLVEVDCEDCGNTYIVSETLVYTDDDGSHYHCGCNKKRK
jgi:hypothetical protein